MISFATATWRAAMAGRWTARIVGSLMVLFILAFLVGEGPPSLTRLTGRERLLFLGMGGLFSGLALAWFWEGWGGFLSLAGWAFFSVVEGKPMWTLPFLVPAVVGLLHVVCWWRLRGPAPPEPMDPVVRARLRVAVGILGAGLSVFLALCGNETFGNPPLMTPRLRPSAGMVGVWQRRGIPGEADVVFRIGPDGSVSGTVGSVPVEGGRIQYNRSWFGRLMNWRTDYLIRGTMGGERFTAPLTVRGAEFTGALFFGPGGPRRLRLRRQ
jgi:hypothetical protein